MDTIREQLTAEVIASARRVRDVTNGYVRDIGGVQSPYNRLAEIMPDIQGDQVIRLEALGIIIGMLAEVRERVTSTTIYQTLTDCGVAPDMSNLDEVLTPTFGGETPKAANIIIGTLELLQTMDAAFSPDLLDAIFAALTAVKLKLDEIEPTFHIPDGSGS